MQKEWRTTDAVEPQPNRNSSAHCVEMAVLNTRSVGAVVPFTA